MRQRVSEKLTAAQQSGADPYGKTLIVEPLGERTHRDTREDRECDRCATYVPPGAAFHFVVVQPTPGLLLVGGLCPDCVTHADVEVVR